MVYAIQPGQVLHLANLAFPGKVYVQVRQGIVRIAGAKDALLNYGPEGTLQGIMITSSDGLQCLDWRYDLWITGDETENIVNVEVVPYNE